MDKNTAPTTRASWATWIADTRGTAHIARPNRETVCGTAKLPAGPPKRAAKSARTCPTCAQEAQR